MKWHKHQKTVFFNIEQILCKMNTEKLSLFPATLSVNSEEIKNKIRRKNFSGKIR